MPTEPIEPTDEARRFIKACTQMIVLNPKSAAPYTSRGLSYAKLDEHAEAIEDFTRAIEIDPSNTEAYEERGYSYRYLDDYPKAIEDYTKAIDIDPNYAVAYLWRGVSYHALGDHAKAIADYTRAIELDPNDQMAYFLRGESYAKLGDHTKAFEDCAQAINIDPSYTAVVIADPTHFAVVLFYKQAPEYKVLVVAAKGADLLAAEIAEIAREHHIMIVENPPLAGQLYTEVDVGESIPPDMYSAVAEVFAFVYKAQNKQP
ncbi:hypothetical protein FACS189487_07850 [Campylobacterota bacterium]|nr:hypothetical protein FACS189487_07850 [Campylobacterota bacterium]